LPQGVLCFISAFFPFPCSSARFPCVVLQPLNLCLDLNFPVVNVLFKENSVNSLGEVWRGGSGRIGQSMEVQMGELGPDLVVIKIFMGYRVLFCNLGWEIVIPCYHMIHCRFAPLSLPRVFLLYMEVSSSTAKEVFKFVIRSSYVLIEGLCVILSAPRMCTVQVPLHYYILDLLQGCPVFCCIPHVCLPHGVGGCEWVDIHKLEGSPCWCPCLRMERRPSISLRMSGFISLECGQRICVTLGKKAECSAVKTENT